MSVNTAERRELSFENLEQAVAEAERLAAGKVRTTGKHTFGQILEHLALTHDMGTGKIRGPRPPFIIRLLMPLIRSRIINGPVKPGFKLPSKAEAFFWPERDFEVAAALAHFKASVENFRQSGPLPIHPVFGKLTAEQVERLNCGHCAMHLSFVHPVD